MSSDLSACTSLIVVGLLSFWLLLCCGQTSFFWSIIQTKASAAVCPAVAVTATREDLDDRGRCGYGVCRTVEQPGSER